LVDNGIQVIGTATTKIGAQKISQNLKKNGQGIILNIDDSIEMNHCIKNIYNKFGKIDILINNAGICHDKLLINMTTKDWTNVLMVNLNGVFHLSKSVLSSMIKNRYGRILTIGSIVGYTGNIGQTNYSASKSGLIGFHKSLALEVANYGITVNMIAPGLIKTDMTNTIDIKKYKKYISKIPMKRFGSTDDIAAAVLFFISDATSYITGQTLHINGGMYMN